jgi:hypothetical protein
METEKLDNVLVVFRIWETEIILEKKQRYRAQYSLHKEKLQEITVILFV